MDKMINRLEQILLKYDEIQAKLQDSAVFLNVKLFTTLSKEAAVLQPATTKYRMYKHLLESLEEADLLAKDSDPSIAEMGKLEKAEINDKLPLLYEELKVLLLPKDPNDDKNILMEIRSAAGGEESSIFAGDLFRMYSRYVDLQNWKIEMMETSETEAGGFAIVSFMIKGENVYSKLKFESGAHRVQRVPKTENQGRVHTSTSTVLVMPEVDEVDFDIKADDLQIDVYRSGGAGGQHVNKTESAVRITHLPTKIVVTCSDGRSQHDNKASAMKVLRAKVQEEMLFKQQEEVGAERKLKVGKGERSEKIRTYNYPQNRVTDHRINYTVNQLDRIINGDLDNLINALINEDQKMKLESGQSL